MENWHACINNYCIGCCISQCGVCIEYMPCLNVHNHLIEKIIFQFLKLNLPPVSKINIFHVEEVLHYYV